MEALGKSFLPSTSRNHHQDQEKFIVRNKITTPFLKDGKRSLDKVKEKPSGPNLARWTAGGIAWTKRQKRRGY